MQKYKLLLLSLFLVLISCKNEYALDIENVSELKNVMLESEKYMKKIEVLPTYSRWHYAEFGGLNLGRIDLLYSTLNYDLKDSIWMNPHDPNWQTHVDTLQNIPGLKPKEWQRLKSDLKILGQYGIHFSSQIYYNNNEFHFFYYAYKTEKYKDKSSIAYLAILPEEQTQTSSFKKHFTIMDRKGDLCCFIFADN